MIKLLQCHQTTSEVGANETDHQKQRGSPKYRDQTVLLWWTKTVSPTSVWWSCSCAIRVALKNKLTPRSCDQAAEVPSNNSTNMLLRQNCGKNQISHNLWQHVTSMRYKQRYIQHLCDQTVRDVIKVAVKTNISSILWSSCWSAVHELHKHVASSELQLTNIHHLVTKVSL